MTGTVAMSAVTASEVDGSHRVTATFDGADLWYESADTSLVASAEGLAGALLLAAISQQRALAIGGAVPDAWLTNVRQLVQTWHEWWGYPAIEPIALRRREAQSPATGVALCFTGGVDSFHTLLTSATAPDTLVFVHGFMVALHDAATARRYEPMLRSVAEATGTRAVIMRTNLWTHPLFVVARKRHVVGGGIAAVGHLLAGDCGTLLLSSGQARSQAVEPPLRFGTHWDLDPLWSSDRVAIVHYGADHTRFEKLAAICDHELVQQHLQVCNERGAHNCSQCDKCVFTMTQLSAMTDPARFAGFDWHEPLAGRIDAVPTTTYRNSYNELLAYDLAPTVAASVRELLARTERAAHVSLARRAARRLRRVMRRR